DRVARHAASGRLGRVHRERHEVEEADPRGSQLGAEGEGAARAHPEHVEEGRREARQGLTGWPDAASAPWRGRSDRSALSQADEPLPSDDDVVVDAEIEELRALHELTC